MKKRLLSLAMSFVMLASLFPGGTSLAQEQEQGVKAVAEEGVPVEGALPAEGETQEPLGNAPLEEEESKAPLGGTRLLAQGASTPLSLTDEAKLELKNVTKIDLYYQGDDGTVNPVVAGDIDVATFDSKKERYLVELTMSDAPVLYAGIREAVNKENVLRVTLDLPGISYRDGAYADGISLDWAVSNGKVTDFGSLTTPSLTGISGYESGKELIYQNLQKLMPFYSLEDIVRQGNRMDTAHDLATKVIQTIFPYKEDSINGKSYYTMVPSITESNWKSVTDVKVIFSDETSAVYPLKEVVDSDKKFAGIIAAYVLEGLNIGYTPASYVLLDQDSTVSELLAQAQALTYDEVKTGVTISGRNGAVVESRLYTDHYTVAQAKLDEDLPNIMANEAQYNIYSDNEVLRAKAKQEVKTDIYDILYVFNYFDRWYNVELKTTPEADKGTPLSDIVFLNVGKLAGGKTLQSYIKSFFSSTATAAKETKATATMYDRIMGSLVPGKNFLSFLEYWIRTVTGSEPRDWFSANFKGILREIEISSLPGVDYSAWKHISKKQAIILPILSMERQEDMYIISVPMQIIVGSINRYSSEQQVKNYMNYFCPKLQSYFEVSASYIPNAVDRANRFSQWIYDTKNAFPANNTLGIVGGNQAPATSEDPVIKWVYSAVGGDAASTFSKGGAVTMSSGADKLSSYMHFVNGSPFEEKTLDIFAPGGFTNNPWAAFSTYTHEGMHMLSASYFYDGAERGDFEYHVNGNTTQVQLDYSITPNLILDHGLDKDYASNHKRSSIQGTDGIERFYAGMFDTFYVLEYLAAKAFLEMTPKQQAAIALQAAYNGLSTPETLKKGGSATKYVRLTEEQIAELNLRTPEDLYDNGIVLKRYKSQGNITHTDSDGYSEDNFYNFYWYIPHNNEGSAGFDAFKRMGHELLGYAGYEKGYEIFRSKKSANDLDALLQSAKAVGDEAKVSSFRDYKLLRWQKVKDSLDSLPYFDASEIQRLYREAMEQDAANSVNGLNNSVGLSKALYGIVKRATEDFTKGDVYTNTQAPTEIATAQELVDTLQSAEWGSYVLTSDLDFSGVTANGDSYITKTFYGRIDGNGHSITGLDKPLLGTMKYGEVQNLYTDGLLAKSSSSALVDRVVVNDKLVTNDLLSEAITSPGGNTKAIASSLVSIEEPAPLENLLNGITVDEIIAQLPAAVDLITTRGTGATADVVWDSLTYDAADTQSQTFTVNGQVTLPVSVLNPDNITLSTTISVTVLGKEEAVLTAVAPVNNPADVPSGTALSDILNLLPVSTTLTTTEGDMTGSITWDSTPNPAYDPANTSAQRVTITGNVILPENVQNKNALSLEVSVDINILAKETTEDGGSTGTTGDSGSTGNSDSTGTTGDGEATETTGDSGSAETLNDEEGKTENYDNFTEYSDLAVNNAAVRELESADSGDTVKIEVSGSQTVIKKRVFETLKDKKAILEVKSGEALIKIDGKDIPENAELRDMDLGVRFNKKTVPSEVLGQFGKEKEALSLSIKHNAGFDFPITIVLNLDKKKMGASVKLYKYMPGSQRVILKSSSKVGTEGKTVFTLSDK